MSLLNELAGAGWRAVQPPHSVDDENVIARWKGEPIKAGFETKTVEESESVFHKKFRTGCYDMELRLYSTPHLASGEIKVEEADGY